MTAWALAAILVAVVLWNLSNRDRDGASGRLPPGPKQELLFGNARQIPPSHSWIYYANLAKRFGR